MTAALIEALVLVLVTSACGAKADGHDASGVFEARETIIAAELAGRIVKMSIEEGQQLAAQAVTVELDCTQLELQLAQAKASDVAITERTTEAAPQVAILQKQAKATEAQLSVQQAQLAALEREHTRVVALVKAQAVPGKQLDDINDQISILRTQMTATQSQVATTRQQARSYTDQVALQNRATTSEREPAQVRIALAEEQVSKCKVVNPFAGTVLTKYAEPFEFATPGMPLYKIADLRMMVLRAYITGTQLGSVKLGQAVHVFVDSGTSASRELPGTLEWVSAQAEFTPKTIQTRSERSNLVYAVKIRVPNDGTIKIGMYAEAAF